MTDPKVDLERIAARLGLAIVPDILEALADPVARGRNVAALAGAGSGRGAMIALAVIQDCLPPSEGTALVLVPDRNSGSRLANALQRITGPEGARVAHLAGPDPESVPRDATVLVGRPSVVLPEVRSGRLHTTHLRLLVVDGMAGMHEPGEWESVQPILETLPADCRRIAVADRPDPAFFDLVERQLPRARKWPESLFPTGGGSTAEEISPDPVPCGLAAPSETAGVVRRFARLAEGEGCDVLLLRCQGEAAATRVAADLSVGGLVCQATQSGVRVDLAGSGGTARMLVGLPLRLDELQDFFGDGDGPLGAVVEPRLAPQLDLLLRRGGWRMAVLPGAAASADLEPLERYRRWLIDEAARGDTLAELIVLEPLFERLGAARLAAVLSRLLRRRPIAGETVRPWVEVEEAIEQDGGRSGAARVSRGTRPAWTRLYFGVGRRDEAKPRDLVGAITGEAGIAGGQIGKVEIMGNFSLVDIDSQIADEVISRLDGATIRGRSVPVRRDRDA